MPKSWFSFRVAGASSVAGILALTVTASLGAAHAIGSRPAEPRVESLLFVRGDSIYSVRADGSRVRRLARGSGPVWSPDGTRFAYEAQALHECGGDCLKVFVANADGTAKRRATDVRPGTLIQIRPAWSPDGTQIVFSESALPVSSFGLAVATVGGSPKYITGEATSWDWAPAWSPDGSWICFTRDDGLYLVTPRGTSTHRIIKGAADSPAWSPDGQTILFTRTHGELYGVAPDGTALLRIAAAVKSAAWSPNGMRIAVSGAAGIFTVNPGGSGRKRLTAGKQDRDAAWSPGGTLIAFQRHADVWLMNADGSHQHILIRNGSASAWQPRVP